MTNPGNYAGARLEINLDAIAANYRTIADQAGSAETAAVIKADAYGLGMPPVARRLARAGCEVYFTATFAEGAALRSILPDARIYVLHGLPDGSAGEFTANQLRPVLSNLDELAVWKQSSGNSDGAILNFDTGMSRLGFSAHDVAMMTSDRNLLAGVKIDYVMSHLACADEPDHPLNAQQLASFRAICALFSGAPASLANTAGVGLGPQYHFDLVRPGIGLYGGNPAGVGNSPFQSVIQLYAKILQVRDVDSQQSVGYGATYRTTGKARIAVAGIGYADGFMRSLGNIGVGAIGGHIVPLVGRVSMDLCTFDVSAVPPELCGPGTEIELIGPQVSLEQTSAAAGTINYEMLTRLGNRFARTYRADGNSVNG